MLLGLFLDTHGQKSCQVNLLAPHSLRDGILPYPPVGNRAVTIPAESSVSSKMLGKELGSESTKEIWTLHTMEVYRCICIYVCAFFPTHLHLYLFWLSLCFCVGFFPFY